ncbi:MAG: transketolase, partial [Gammaproteobacteria bacterium]|nr:transketolase [Gammaproteobacteria bacterium]
LPHQARDQETLDNIKKGGYILIDCERPELILLATGSEVDLAVKAAATLSEQKRRVRVVSMPSCDVFNTQAESYRQKVLPSGVPVIAIEAGVTAPWRAYVGEHGKVIGLDRFGESAPANALFEYFGFTVKHIIETAKTILE